MDFDLKRKSPAAAPGRAGRRTGRRGGLPDLAGEGLGALAAAVGVDGIDPPKELGAGRQAGERALREPVFGARLALGGGDGLEVLGADLDVVGDGVLQRRPKNARRI